MQMSFEGKILSHLIQKPTDDTIQLLGEVFVWHLKPISSKAHQPDGDDLHEAR